MIAEVTESTAEDADRAVEAARGGRSRRGVALFLASDESSYVNRATFLVDGGLTAAYVTPE